MNTIIWELLVIGSPSKLPYELKCNFGVNFNEIPVLWQCPKCGEIASRIGFDVISLTPLNTVTVEA